MLHSREEICRLTHALIHAQTAAAAVEALRGYRERAALEGLVELIHAPPAARAAVAALDALDDCNDPIVTHALGAALGSSHASVRLAALQAMKRHRVVPHTDGVVRCLRRDTSWPVRRAAVAFLGEQPGAERWQVLIAADDPHWRVRHALLKVLLAWGESLAERAEMEHRLAAMAPGPRVQGICRYLQHCWTGSVDTRLDARATEVAAHTCAFWDWDSAVLARNLERLTEVEKRGSLDVMPFLLGHADVRVRKSADETLRRWGTARHLTEVVRLLDEPRTEAFDTIASLLEQLDLDRTEEIVRLILGQADPSPAQLAWALPRVVVALPEDEASATLLRFTTSAAAFAPSARQALAEAIGRWTDERGVDLLHGFLDDDASEVQFQTLRGLATPIPCAATLMRLLCSPDARVRAEAVKHVLASGGDRSLLEPCLDDAAVEVRVALARGLVGRGDDPWLEHLQSDPHPHVRAAGLTPARAATIVAEHDRLRNSGRLEPGGETSWHVLAHAARIARVSFWELEPQPCWQPPPPPPAAVELLPFIKTAPTTARPIGPAKLLVAPLGISGHYGLPVEGFGRAIEAGVNLLFWEPGYDTLTTFVTCLSGPDRSALHIVAGTFEADGVRIRRDAERALRLLKLDRVSLFLLFWVQSWQRVTPDVIESLQQLKDSGKVAMVGLSTHSRPLAVEAIDRGWNPVMVRHSIAHRGAEEQVFAQALAAGASIVTFNNTCYGRLLRRGGTGPVVTAADCYRYSLGQPAVCACLSAPATLAQLDENLCALRDPTLPAERVAQLLAHGDSVYREDSLFNRFVRNS